MKIAGIAAALALLLCTQSAQADDVEGWQVHWDNDVWAKGKTDRWYTNGLRVSWTFNKPPTSELSKLFQDGSRWFLWDDKVPTLGYTFGQTMYSPQNISLSTPQPNDRPWGAFFFFGVTAHAYQTEVGGKSEFRATELKFGTTGRYALGEEAQTFIHRITSSPIPQGWDQQLKTRPGIQLSHARVYRREDRSGRDWFGFQWGWGASVGSLRSYANLNAAITVGDLSGPDSPLLIGNEGDFVAQDFNKRNQFKKPFAFLAANVTGIAHNYFVNGSTPYGKPNLDLKRGYTMVQAGVSLPLQEWINNKWPRLVYAQSTRSSEFKHRDTGRAESRQRWGTFSLHWDTND